MFIYSQIFYCFNRGFFFFFNGTPQLLFLSVMNSSAASLAGLTVEEMTLNSSFRKKHLEIKTEESGNEKILTVKLSWTILHYTDSLIGHEKKWQFKIKAFEWDKLSILKFEYFWYCFCFCF